MRVPQPDAPPRHEPISQASEGALEGEVRGLRKTLLRSGSAAEPMLAGGAQATGRAAGQSPGAGGGRAAG
jgi:hypothetical protein